MAMLKKIMGLDTIKYRVLKIKRGLWLYKEDGEDRRVRAALSFPVILHHNSARKDLAAFCNTLFLCACVRSLGLFVLFFLCYWEIVPSN